MPRQSGLRRLAALLVAACTACGSGGRPAALLSPPPGGAGDTDAPPSSSGDVPGGPAAAASITASPLPPVNPVTPVLQAISTLPFTAQQAQAVRGITGVRAAARVSLALITANAPGGTRQFSVAAVDPLEFRPLSPAPSAQASFVWQGLLAGDLFLAHEEQPVLGVALGTDLALKGPSSTIAPRVGGLAANGVPNLAGGLVSFDKAQQLGLPGPTMLLVGIASGVSPDVVGAAMRRLLPQAQVQPMVGLVEHALISGPSAAKLLGSFSYKPNPDGSVTEDAAWVNRNIVTRTVPILGQVTCNKLMFPQLIGALTELEQEGLAGLINAAEYQSHSGNCYQARFVDSDPSRGLSYHAWGIAIDINRSENPEGGTSHQDPRLVAAFEHWGFRWGALFYPPDPMHFELAGLLQP